MSEIIADLSKNLQELNFSTLFQKIDKHLQNQDIEIASNHLTLLSVLKQDFMSGNYKADFYERLDVFIKVAIKDFGASNEGKPKPKTNTVVQNHYGSGDNIGGDKIINNK